MSSLKNIVIVGASGGIYAARALEKALPKSHRIVLIEKNDYGELSSEHTRCRLRADH